MISMAITKIHPIKSTLNLAIDYITKSEKTDEKILVSSFKYHPSTAHTQFIKIRKIIFYSIFLKQKRSRIIPLLQYLIFSCL
ncbi:hypothetical protein HMPREF3183_01880 [Peptostreptococcus anaerobius]|nr:hypothetical protein HMPREF3183_01880 [Peptostreptococcus anaerobius]